MKLTLILITAFLAGCAVQAPKPADGSRTVTVPAAMVAKCNAEGGCALLTKAQLAELVEMAQEQATNACRKGAL